MPITKKLPVECASSPPSPNTKRAWRVSEANANCWVPLGASTFARVWWSEPSTSKTLSWTTRSRTTLPQAKSTSAATAGGVQDEVGNLLRVSDQRQVTGVQLDRLRPHTVCQETLQLRRRGSILLRYGIPRRPELPRGCGCPRGEKRVGDPPLNRVEHTRPAWIDAVGEVLEEGLLAQLGEAAGLDQAGIRRWRGKFGSQCRIVLAGIRRASSDVDKGRDFRINPGLADDCSCPGVTYEDRRPVLQRKDAACGRDVVRKRGQRVLRRLRLQADTLKTSNDFGPRGTVRICTMDQDDIAGTEDRFSLCLA